MKKRTISAILVSFLLHSGCISGSPPPEHFKQEAATALDRARTSLLAEKKVAVDVLWVLQQIQSKQQDAAIEGFIQNMKGQIRNPSYLPGVFPDLEKVALPESIQPGIRRFFTYLDAPRGQPEETALRHLKQFIAEDAGGYILTHQFIVLLLAEQAGLPFTEDIRRRKAELLNEIYAEQMRAGSVDCLDLYMERTALILFYGDQNKISKDQANEWVKTIINLQLPDGSWPVSKSAISYDGETTTLFTPRPHTTVLAIMALQAYVAQG
jgi:hypothetical protein